MSCTRSLFVLATMMFSNNSGPESLKISAGRFHPSNISFCFLENENSEGSLRRGGLDNPDVFKSSRDREGEQGEEEGETRTHVKSGSSSFLLRKTAGSGSASQGGKTLPCSLEDRHKMVFSAVGSSRLWRGPLGFGALGGAAVGPAVLRVSACAMRSRHLALRRDFSAAVGASLTAFMYNSAAWMAFLKASWPEVRLILASYSCAWRLVSLVVLLYG